MLKLRRERGKSRFSHITILFACSAMTLFYWQPLAEPGGD